MNDFASLLIDRFVTLNNRPTQHLVFAVFFGYKIYLYICFWVVNGNSLTVFKEIFFPKSSPFSITAPTISSGAIRIMIP